MVRKLALIEQQISEANNGHPTNFDMWQNRTDVVLRSVFGVDSAIYDKFRKVKYMPGVYSVGSDTSGYRIRGIQRAVTILDSGKLELELSAEVATPPANSGAAEHHNQIFIVHGQDDARKFELASFLQNLTGEQPTILHQQPNRGEALIEKFERNAATVGFAVVLLTADDTGRPRLLDPQDDQLRARQNVVFEMGFFFGLIGRRRVAVLYEEGVELPSDINGIVYTLLDKAGGWKAKLAVELESGGITVDWSAIARS